ncbi:glycosyltransferase family 9 protein [Roseibacterium beibuensis]|uniref:glycosyltransferase family 9 protein n=1 Tax=[Roseibacterium] beibuensis TaxID=1193142 RepID=UPI00217EDEC5|nr:glycosyltransferase family 9 protein [Roseibacterium beibuensis]MCS6622610.1 glycosyltransferase family 9 protein [Roseibacterium beibuensis]
MTGRFPILYIAEAGAQDAALSCGVLAYLVEAMPQARFTVVGSPASAPLFGDTPRLDRLIILERESRLEWIGLWNQVRSTTWGLIVDMRGSALSGKLKRQKRAVRGEREAGVHAVELAARVLQLDEVPAPKLFVSDDTRASVEALIPPGDGPILAVGPGAAWMGRRWPAERFAKVAATLVGDGGPLEGGRVLVVGDDSDRDAAHTIRLALPRHRTIELQGRLKPLQVVAAVQRSALYLGGDSLWTDLAVAAGTPVVAAFGPSDEVERGPWGGVAVRGPRSVDEYRKIDPRLDQAIQHMNDLPADRVLKAARKVLAERV